MVSAMRPAFHCEKSLREGVRSAAVQWSPNVKSCSPSWSMWLTSYVRLAFQHCDLGSAEGAETVHNTVQDAMPNSMVGLTGRRLLNTDEPFEGEAARGGAELGAELQKQMLQMQARSPTSYSPEGAALMRRGRRRKRGRIALFEGFAGALGRSCVAQGRLGFWRRLGAAALRAHRGAG